jgi:hypothetical protein
MNTAKEYTTYWYESQDGEMEPIEIETSMDPPIMLTMPAISGSVESFMLIGEDFDVLGTRFDD